MGFAGYGSEVGLGVSTYDEVNAGDCSRRAEIGPRAEVSSLSPDRDPDLAPVCSFRATFLVPLIHHPVQSLCFAVVVRIPALPRARVTQYLVGGVQGCLGLDYGTDA